HLIAQAKPGDTVVFYFSGHGQQIPNHDGSAFDGKDESLVPYDYLSGTAQDGDKTNLRDKEIRAFLQQLRHERMQGKDGKLDGNITLIIDSCHSGGIARGDSLIRGRNWDPAIDGPEPSRKPQGTREASG